MRSTSRLQVFPRPIPEINSVSVSPVSHSSFMQVFLTLTYTEHQFQLYQPAAARDAFRLLGDITLPTRRHSSWHQAACFSGNISAYNVLTPILRELGFSDPQEMRVLAEKVATEVSHISNIVSRVSRNRSVLPLEMEILRERIFLVTEQDWMERAIRESRMEFERNYGMVPTAKEALRLKCVKVQKEKKYEVCTICLEELTDFAAGMPCKHLFHGPCIQKWLETSHYCPVCRFEMPTGR